MAINPNKHLLAFPVTETNQMSRPWPATVIEDDRVLISELEVTMSFSHMTQGYFIGKYVSMMGNCEGIRMRFRVIAANHGYVNLLPTGLKDCFFHHKRHIANAKNTNKSHQS